jgi:hypothetical protein
MNNRGVALILSYMVMATLTILSSAFLVSSSTEGIAARNYSNSSRAFWVAEAGLATVYQNWRDNNVNPTAGTISMPGGGAYTVDATSFPIVKITGNLGASHRVIQASFIRVPLAFDNTVSVGRNMTLNGLLCKVEAHDKTRISGIFSKPFGGTAVFDDKQEGVSQNNTTIPIPDANNNGTSNEFSDFVAFGQQAAAGYPASEVVYLPTDDDVTIFPNTALVGKKIIYVQGSAPGKGNVNIVFAGTWQDNQDLTVISTGKVTYLQPLEIGSNSRLSTISWDNYVEGAIFRSQHESLIYTHNDANFVDFLNWSELTGNIIANRDLTLWEVLTYQKFVYSNRAQSGDMPPGFKFLNVPTGTPRFIDWQEVRT